jgi:hypothetical protein
MSDYNLMLILLYQPVQVIIDVINLLLIVIASLKIYLTTDCQDNTGQLVRSSLLRC